MKHYDTLALRVYTEDCNGRFPDEEECAGCACYVGDGICMGTVVAALPFSIDAMLEGLDRWDGNHKWRDVDE